MTPGGNRLAQAKVLLKAALDAGAQEADLLLGGGSELSITVRMGELDVLEQSDAASLKLRVFHERRVGVVSASNPAGVEPARFAAEAVALAKLGESDEFNRLPEPELYARELPELDLLDQTPPPDTARGIELALSAEAAALNADERIDNSQGGFYFQERGDGVYLSSNGCEIVRATSDFGLAAQPVARDSGGEMRTAFWSISARHFADLPIPEEIGREAAARVLGLLDPRGAPTGEFPIIFEGASSAPGLLRRFFGSASGAAVRRRQSYLIDRVGETVASELFTLVDEPFRPRGLGSRACDGEGLPCAKREIVSRGVLQFHPCDLESARRLDLSPSGHGSWGGGVRASNLYLLPGEQSVDALIASTKRGLLLRRMLGPGNLNASTGHWSQACEGFWIEGGELAYPVSKVTIAGMMDEVLRGVDAVADDLDFTLGAVCSPTLRTAAMTLAGS